MFCISTKIPVVGSKMDPLAGLARDSAAPEPQLHPYTAPKTGPGSATQNPTAMSTQFVLSSVSDMTNCKGIENSSSSPDSAIDLTEDVKPSPFYNDVQAIPLQPEALTLVGDVLNELLEEVCNIGGRRRGKKKREKISDAQKLALMKDCGAIGWRRVLVKNDDGWGFNFISPTGIRLSGKELEKFLKKQKIQMNQLIFQPSQRFGSPIPDSSSPRKKVRLTVGVAVDKIRDIRLTKMQLLEQRKNKILQRRSELSQKPQFKSISEFLASLDRSDSPNSSYAGSCSDISRLDEDSDCEERAVDSDTSFSYSERHSGDEVAAFCKSIVATCVDSMLKDTINSSEESLAKSPLNSPAKPPDGIKLTIRTPDTKKKSAKKKKKRRDSIEENVTPIKHLKIKPILPVKDEESPSMGRQEHNESVNTEETSPLKRDEINDTAPAKKYSIFRSKNSEKMAAQFSKTIKLEAAETPKPIINPSPQPTLKLKDMSSLLEAPAQPKSMLMTLLESAPVYESQNISEASPMLKTLLETSSLDQQVNYNLQQSQFESQLNYEAQQLNYENQQSHFIPHLNYESPQSQMLKTLLENAAKFEALKNCDSTSNPILKTFLEAPSACVQNSSAQSLDVIPVSEKSSPQKVPVPFQSSILKSMLNRDPLVSRAHDNPNISVSPVITNTNTSTTIQSENRKDAIAKLNQLSEMTVTVIDESKSKLDQLSALTVTKVSNRKCENAEMSQSNSFQANSDAAAKEIPAPQKYKPASRTHGRVISSEDAMKATDAIIIPSEIMSQKDKVLRDGKMTPEMPILSKSVGSPSLFSPPIAPPLVTPIPPTPTPTPSLPTLSPFPNDSETNDTHSNLTTPSLPALSPMPQQGFKQFLNPTPGGSQATTPSLPSLSPKVPNEDTAQSTTSLAKPWMTSTSSQKPRILKPDPLVSGPLSVMIPGINISIPKSDEASPTERELCSSSSSLTSPRMLNSVSPAQRKSPRSCKGMRYQVWAAEGRLTSKKHRKALEAAELSSEEVSPSPQRPEFMVDEKETSAGGSIKLDLRDVSHDSGSLSDNSPKQARAPQRRSPRKSVNEPDLQEKEVSEYKEEAKTEAEKVHEKSVCDESNDDDLQKQSCIKKKKGRPPKKKIIEEEHDLSVSELAERKAENQISPITREKTIFPEPPPKKEDSSDSIQEKPKTPIPMVDIPKLKLYQAGISPYSRRKSVDTLVVPCRINKEERSKSIDTSSPPSYSESETVDNLELLKQTLIRQSSLNNLLMKKISSSPTTEKEPEVDKEFIENFPLSLDETSSENPSASVIDQVEELDCKAEAETISKDVDENKLQGTIDEISSEPSTSEEIINDIKVVIESPTSANDAEVTKHAKNNELKEETLPILEDKLEPTTTTVTQPIKKVKVIGIIEAMATAVIIRDKFPKPSPPPEDDRPITPEPMKCTIYEENLDLVHGLRVLTRIKGNFYPGRVRAHVPGEIFGVSIDGERGDKEHIYTKEELLEKVILEIRPMSLRYTPVGTRVCAYWSNQLNFLYPGTVESLGSNKLVTIDLDDGTQRVVHIDSVRLLPKNYPKVEDTNTSIGIVEDSTMAKLPQISRKVCRSPSLGKSKSVDEKETKPKQWGKYENIHKKVKKKKMEREEKAKRKYTHTEEFLAKQKQEKGLIKDCKLDENKLTDGLRLLVRIDGNFYPGRLNPVRPPDIYGVMLDNERNFRQTYYAREQLLQDAILEVKLKNVDIPMGMRVCAYWSSKYHFLHPGTVIPNNGNERTVGRYLNIQLDDGDCREINIDQMRMLPEDYPVVEYEPGLSLHSPGKRRDRSRPSSRGDTEDSEVNENTSLLERKKKQLGKKKRRNSELAVSKPVLVKESKSKIIERRKSESQEIDIPEEETKLKEAEDEPKPFVNPPNKFANLKKSSTVTSEESDSSQVDEIPDNNFTTKGPSSIVPKIKPVANLNNWTNLANLEDPTKKIIKTDLDIKKDKIVEKFSMAKSSQNNSIEKLMKQDSSLLNKTTINSGSKPAIPNLSNLKQVYENKILGHDNKQKVPNTDLVGMISKGMGNLVGRKVVGNSANPNLHHWQTKQNTTEIPKQHSDNTGMYSSHPSLNTPCHQPQYPTMSPCHQPQYPPLTPCHQPQYPPMSPCHQPQYGGMSPYQSPINAAMSPYHQPSNAAMHPLHQAMNPPIQWTMDMRPTLKTQQPAFEKPLIPEALNPPSNEPPQVMGQKVKSRLSSLIEKVSGKVQDRRGSLESENPIEEVSKSYKEQASMYKRDVLSPLPGQSSLEPSGMSLIQQVPPKRPFLEKNKATAEKFETTLPDKNTNLNFYGNAVIIPKQAGNEVVNESDELQNKDKIESELTQESMRNLEEESRISNLLESNYKESIANQSDNENEITSSEDLNLDDEGYLNANNTVPGTNVLILKDGYFHPGTLSGTDEEGNFAVKLKHERRGKPQYFSKKDLIAKAVLEREAMSNESLEHDTRVAGYWSKSFDYLHPGTIVGAPFGDYVRVYTDDGDNRELNIHDIRLLPKHYPKVLYPKKIGLIKETINIDNNFKIKQNNLTAKQDDGNREKDYYDEEFVKQNEETKDDITEAINRIEALAASKIKSEESSRRSSRSSLDQSCQGALDSILDKLTSEDEMREYLLSNCLKKFSPSKGVAKSPRAKSPRTSTDRKEKKTKKINNKKMKYSPQQSQCTENQQDPIDEIMSICKESNILVSPGNDKGGLRESTEEQSLVISTSLEKMDDGIQEGVPIEKEDKYAFTETVSFDQEKIIAEKIVSIYNKQPNKKIIENKKIVDSIPKKQEYVGIDDGNSVSTVTEVEEQEKPNLVPKVIDMKKLDIETGNITNSIHIKNQSSNDKEELVNEYGERCEEIEKIPEIIQKQMAVFDFDDEADEQGGKLDSSKLARLPRKSKLNQEINNSNMQQEELETIDSKVETQEKEHININASPAEKEHNDLKPKSREKEYIDSNVEQSLEESCKLNLVEKDIEHGGDETKPIEMLENSLQVTKDIHIESNNDKNNSMIISASDCKQMDEEILKNKKFHLLRSSLLTESSVETSSGESSEGTILNTDSVLNSENIIAEVSEVATSGKHPDINDSGEEKVNDLILAKDINSMTRKEDLNQDNGKVENAPTVDDHLNKDLFSKDEKTIEIDTLLKKEAIVDENIEKTCVSENDHISLKESPDDEKLNNTIVVTENSNKDLILDEKSASPNNCEKENNDSLLKTENYSENTTNEEIILNASLRKDQAEYKIFEKNILLNESLMTNKDKINCEGQITKSIVDLEQKTSLSKKENTSEHLLKMVNLDQQLDNDYCSKQENANNQVTRKEQLEDRLSEKEKENIIDNKTSEYKTSIDETVVIRNESSAQENKTPLKRFPPSCLISPDIGLHKDMLNDSFSEELGLEDQISKIVETLMDDSFEEERDENQIFPNNELPANRILEIEPNAEQSLEKGLVSEKVETEDKVHVKVKQMDTISEKGILKVENLKMGLVSENEPFKDNDNCILNKDMHKKNMKKGSDDELKEEDTTTILKSSAQICVDDEKIFGKLNMNVVVDIKKVAIDDALKEEIFKDIEDTKAKEVDINLQKIDNNDEVKNTLKIKQKTLKEFKDATEKKTTKDSFDNYMELSSNIKNNVNKIPFSTEEKVPVNKNNEKLEQVPKVESTERGLKQNASENVPSFKEKLGEENLRKSRNITPLIDKFPLKDEDAKLSEKLKPAPKIISNFDVEASSKIKNKIKEVPLSMKETPLEIESKEKLKPLPKIKNTDQGFKEDSSKDKPTSKEISIKENLQEKENKDKLKPPPKIKSADKQLKEDPSENVASSKEVLVEEKIMKKTRNAAPINDKLPLSDEKPKISETKNKNKSLKLQADTSNTSIVLGESNEKVEEVNIEMKGTKITEKDVNEKQKKIIVDQTKYCEIKIKKLEEIKPKNKSLETMELPVDNSDPKVVHVENSEKESDFNNEFKDAKITDQNLVEKQNKITLDQTKHCEIKIKKLEEIKIDSFSIEKEMKIEDLRDNEEAPMFIDDQLPKGWYRSIIKRKSGDSTGKYDVHINGHGKRFRSIKELETFCSENKVTELDASTVDWSPFGKKYPDEENVAKNENDKEKVTIMSKEDEKMVKLNHSDGQQMKKSFKKKGSVNNKFKKSVNDKKHLTKGGKAVSKPKKSLKDEKAKKVIQKAKKLLDKKSKKITNDKKETKKLVDGKLKSNKLKKSSNNEKPANKSKSFNKTNKKIIKFDKSEDTKREDENLNISNEAKTAENNVEMFEDEHKETEGKKKKVLKTVKCSPEKEKNEKISDIKVENKIKNSKFENKLITEKNSNKQEKILECKNTQDSNKILNTTEDCIVNNKKCLKNKEVLLKLDKKKSHAIEEDLLHAKLNQESAKVNNYSKPITNLKKIEENEGEHEYAIPEEQSENSIDVETTQVIVSPLKTRSKNKGISPRKTRSKKDGKLSKLMMKSKVMKRRGLKLIKKKLKTVFDEKKDVKPSLPDVNDSASVANLSHKTKDDDAHLFKVPSLPSLQKSLRFNGLKKYKSEPSIKTAKKSSESAKKEKEEAALEQVKNDNIEMTNRITRNKKETSIRDYFSKDKTKKDKCIENDIKQSNNEVSNSGQKEDISKITSNDDLQTKIKEHVNTVEKYFSKCKDDNNLKKGKTNERKDCASKEQLQEARKMRNKNKTLSESSEGSDPETDIMQPRITRNTKDKSPNATDDSGSDSETEIIEPRITRNRKEKSPDDTVESGSDSETEMIEPRITRNRKDKSPDVISDHHNMNTDKTVKETVLEKETRSDKKLVKKMPKTSTADTDLKEGIEKTFNKKIKASKVEEARLNEVSDLEDELNKSSDLEPDTKKSKRKNMTSLPDTKKKLKSSQIEENILNNASEINDTNGMQNNKKPKRDKSSEKAFDDNSVASTKNKMVNSIDKEENTKKKLSRSPSKESVKDLKYKMKIDPSTEKNLEEAKVTKKIGQCSEKSIKGSQLKKKKDLSPEKNNKIKTSASKVESFKENKCKTKSEEVSQNSVKDSKLKKKIDSPMEKNVKTNKIKSVSEKITNESKSIKKINKIDLNNVESTIKDKSKKEHKNILPELEINNDKTATNLTKNKIKKCSKEDEYLNKKSDLKNGKTPKLQSEKDKKQDLTEDIKLDSKVNSTLKNKVQKGKSEESKDMKQKKTGKSKSPKSSKEDCSDSMRKKKNTNKRDLTMENVISDEFKTPEIVTKVGRKSQNNKGKEFDCDASGERDNNISNVKIKQTKYDKEDDNQLSKDTDKIISSNSESVVSPRMTRLLDHKEMEKNNKMIDTASDALIANILGIKENKGARVKKTKEQREKEKSEKIISDALNRNKNRKEKASEKLEEKQKMSLTSYLSLTPQTIDSTDKEITFLTQKRKLNDILTPEKDDTQDSDTTKKPHKKRKFNLGPASKRKFVPCEDSDDSDLFIKSNAKEAILSTVNEIECVINQKSSPESKSEEALESPNDPKYSFILKRKHSKCKIKLVNLFKEELCQAKCAHCHELCGGSEPATFSTHLVHIDIEQKKITMECQSCEWTTVRRIGVSSRVV